MKTVLSPKKTDGHLCRCVSVCGHVYIGVCIPIHNCWPPCLSASTCVWMCKVWVTILFSHSQLFANTNFYIFFLCICMFVYVCILLGDFGVWSTQSMNKWKALAVGTEVFAKSEDPSSLWTHPAVPLILSLSAETKTLVDQATLNHKTSARAPRDGHGIEGWRRMER